MATGIPLVLMEDFTDVRSVPQDRVQLATSEPGLIGPVGQSLVKELLAQAVERVIVISVKFVDSADFSSVIGMDFDQPSSIFSIVSIAVRGFADEPS